MQITYRPPADRGVTQLVYVGDDDAVDNATKTPSSRQLMVLVAGAAVAAYLIFFEKTKSRRTSTRTRVSRIRRIARSRR
jgi:hypothetical protein